MIFYLAAYTFMQLGAFGIVAIIEGKEETNLELSDYAGLASRYPLLSALLAVFMFSLAGLTSLCRIFRKVLCIYCCYKS